MCTAFTFSQDPMYFGRNMDIEYSFGESVVITPRDFPISTHFAGTLSHHYAMIGMANAAQGYPLYAEAANEKGLCMAGLNFPDNAYYLPVDAVAQLKQQGKIPLAPYELIPVILGRCENLSQAKELLSQVELVQKPFLPALPFAPLHWIVSERCGSLTVERTEAGLQIYDNPYGVLTNNPPFPFHLENVRQYLHLSAQYPENRLCREASLTPFGQGMGALGIPGDFSPASRFIKTVFCKFNSLCETDEYACVSQVFHILDAVAMVRGTVITPEGRPDITTYSCCINAQKGSYYYKTYENNQIIQIPMTDSRREGTHLMVFALETQPQIAVR